MVVNGDSTMKAVAVINRPIPKAMGNVYSMVYIIIATYSDSLSLYRLEGIIKRYAGNISSATFNGLMALAKQA